MNNKSLKIPTITIDLASSVAIKKLYIDSSVAASHCNPSKFADTDERMAKIKGASEAAAALLILSPRMNAVVSEWKAQVAEGSLTAPVIYLAAELLNLYQKNRIIVDHGYNDTNRYQYELVGTLAGSTK
jgi:hypothetical protein